MRAKACTRCRQWKVGCDANTSDGDACTRCRKNGVPCVFDRSFRRTAKRRRALELQQELDELRSRTVVPSERPQEMQHENVVTNAAALLPAAYAIAGIQSPGSGVAGNAASTHKHLIQPQSGFEIEPQSLCIVDKSIDDLSFTAAHTNELYRIYFTRCHPYLPFSMTRSVETIYEKCPLLHWVICAVALPEDTRSQLEVPVRNLIAEVLDPTKGSNIETVQALLILCMWPWPFSSQRSDSSFIYSGMATQIALSIGLHRPIDDGFDEGASESLFDDQMRRTTWLACFIMAQIQASRRGVPATIPLDHSLLASLDHPEVPTELSCLCSIAYLTVNALHSLGTCGSNNVGLIEPSARTTLLSIFSKQFDELWVDKLEKSNDIVHMYYLNSRLHVWSFGLHNDIPLSTTTALIISKAQQDAICLIQVACEKNLSLVPFYYRRAVCYAATLLYRIKLGPYGWQDDMTDHHVARAQQALSAAQAPNLGQFLAAIMSPDNRQVFEEASAAKESPHRARMAAFLVFDYRRVYADLQQNSVFASEFLDFDALPWVALQ